MRQIEEDKELLQKFLSLLDIRVPKTRDNLQWRMAMFLRFQSQIIQKEDKKSFRSWEEVGHILKEPDVQALKARSLSKCFDAFDNQGLSQINIAARLQETISPIRQKPSEQASSLAVSSPTLINQAHMPLQQ